MRLQTTYSQINNQELKTWFKYSLFFAACSLLVFSSCDDSFQPLRENDQYHFSIYGTLDAAVDTQWIRVGIPRQSVNETPNPTRITVILKHVETGQSIEMQDSLFTSGNLLNYWTKMPVKNEETYTIQAIREDGKSSTVSVTIPKELPTPLVFENKNFSPQGFYIYINDSVEHIADLQTKWYVLLNPQTDRLKKTFTFTYRNTIKYTGTYGGAWFTFADSTMEREYITNNTNADFAILHQQFYIAAGGPGWNDNLTSIDDLEYFLDGTASNVENGLGYVVGIDSKWMAYKTCFTADSSNVIPCEPEDPFW